MFVKMKRFISRLTCPLVLVLTLMGGLMAPVPASANIFSDIAGIIDSVLGIATDVGKLAIHIPDDIGFIYEQVTGLVKVIPDMFKMLDSMSDLLVAVNKGIVGHPKITQKVEEHLGVVGDWLSGKVHNRLDDAAGVLETYSNMVSLSTNPNTGKIEWFNSPLSAGTLNSQNHQTYNAEQEMNSKEFMSNATGGSIGMVQPKANWKATYEVAKYYGSYAHLSALSSLSINATSHKYSRLAPIEGAAMSFMSNFVKMFTTLAVGSGSSPLNTAISSIIQKTFMLVQQLFTLPFTIMHVIDQFDHISQGVNGLNTGLTMTRYESSGRQLLANAEMSQPGAAYHKKNAQ